MRTAFARARRCSRFVAIAAAALGAAACNDGCGSCGKATTTTTSDAAPAPSPSSAPSVVAEALPRCRAETARFAIPGDDAVVGDVAIGSSGLLLGIVRREAGKRVASVVRASLDLGDSRLVDVGPAMGDDPAPSPRWNGAAPYAAFVVRRANDAGPGALRELRVVALDDAFASGKPRPSGSVVQQADESTAFDLAWPDGPGPALVAWDEDAPFAKDAAIDTIRGFVKVQSLADGAKPRVASPETSDAESPRLVPRPGGFWLAWLARRAEEGPAPAVEGPGERRAYRWVELVALDAKGEPASPVRRVSSEKGRAVTFELSRSGAGLVVMVQDEAAYSDGVGARIVRYTVEGDRIEASDVVDAGVGHALADLVPAFGADGGARWLAWNDVSERTHLTPLGVTLGAAGSDTVEPSLDSARVLAATPDALYALVDSAGAVDGSGGRSELRRFLCR